MSGWASRLLIVRSSLLLIWLGERKPSVGSARRDPISPVRESREIVCYVAFISRDDQSNRCSRLPYRLLGTNSANRPHGHGLGQLRTRYDTGLQLCSGFRFVVKATRLPNHPTPPARSQRNSRHGPTGCTPMLSLGIPSIRYYTSEVENSRSLFPRQPLCEKKIGWDEVQ